jgi:hypothetical protein
VVSQLCVGVVACHVDGFADVVVRFKVGFSYFLLFSREESSLEFGSMWEWGCWLEHTCLFYAVTEGFYNFMELGFNVLPLLVGKLFMFQSV